MKKKQKTKLFTIIGIIAVILLSGIVFIVSNNEEIPFQTYTDIILTTLDNQNIRLSEYEGKPIILQTMASWCTSCLLQAEELKKVQKIHPEAVIISVDIDTRRDTITTVNSFKEQAQANWLFTLDSLNEFVTKYNIQSLDTTIVINKKGEIILRDDKITSVNTITGVLKNE